MARIRSIKPEFWSSEQIMECSPNVRLLFIGLWNFCDDAGRHPNTPRQIKALVFPGDDFTADQIAGWIGELEANGLLEIYTVGARQYIQVTGWHHQRIDKPQAPKYPAKVSESAQDPFEDHSTNGIDGKDRTGPDKGKDRTGPDQGSPNGPGSGRPVGLSEDFRKRLVQAVEPEIPTDRDFGPIERAMAGGASEDDVIEGIRRALAERTDPKPFRTWRAFPGWIAGVVEDRKTGKRRAHGSTAPPYRPSKPPMGDLEIKDMLARRKAEKAGAA